MRLKLRRTPEKYTRNSGFRARRLSAPLLIPEGYHAGVVSVQQHFGSIDRVFSQVWRESRENPCMPAAAH
jgi:hypothetical protein